MILANLTPEAAERARALAAVDLAEAVIHVVGDAELLPLIDRYLAARRIAREAATR